MVGGPSTLVPSAAPASRAAAVLLALVTVAVLVPAADAAAPPELSEFPLAEGVSPFGIALGSDGAMWFTERGTDSVGRIETAGALGPWVRLETGADPTAIATGVDDAVWFTEQGTNRIGRVAPDGSLSEFPVPTDGAAVAGIAPGPDGAMWFTERSAHRIGRIATDGTISEFSLPSSLPGPLGITAGPDGALWFTEHRGNRIGRITTGGDVTEWPLPIAASLPSGITAGPDGALWFTMRAANRIGRITTGGEITTYPVPTAASDPTAITTGWDGALWFTGPDTDVIGRVALDGSITEFPLPTVGASPFSIAAGPDDAVWFTEGNASAIGRLGAPASPADMHPADDPDRLARRRGGRRAWIGARGRLPVQRRRRLRPRHLRRLGAGRRGDRHDSWLAPVRRARDRRSGQQRGGLGVVPGLRRRRRLHRRGVPARGAVGHARARPGNEGPPHRVRRGGRRLPGEPPGGLRRSVDRAQRCVTGRGATLGTADAARDALAHGTSVGGHLPGHHVPVRGPGLDGRRRDLRRGLQLREGDAPLRAMRGRRAASARRVR